MTHAIVRPNPRIRSITTRTGAALLGLASAFHAIAADPDAPAPKPSDAAHQLIGADAVAFGPNQEPAAGVRLNRALGTSDFAVGLSFQADDSGLEAIGDLVSLWDAKQRQGFTLSIIDNIGVTTSQPNRRHLQFGIDAGTTPTWRREGRPGQNILGFALAVHEGRLYVGTCEPNLPHRGQVYRYEGTGQWESMGSPDGSNAVTTLAVHDGALYAGTGEYRTSGSAMAPSDNTERGGRIFRFEGPDQWAPAGDLAPSTAIGGLTSFGGRLYASSLYQPAGFFRYEGGETWTSIPTPGGRRVQALGVFEGAMYAGSYDGPSLARFDGETWTDMGPVADDVTQSYSFAGYQNSLYVGAWPTGKVYRLESGDRWIDAGRLGNETEVMGMLIHNGVFYAGSLPLAEVYRYEGETEWSRLEQLDHTPDVTYRRAWTMASFQGRLFVTTLPTGEIWSMSAGRLASHDHEVPAGWHDVIAQRTDGTLRLFLDGRLVAQADAADLDLQTESLELKIGDGPRGRFVGSIKNAWFDETP